MLVVILLLFFLSSFPPFSLLPPPPVSCCQDKPCSDYAAYLATVTSDLLLGFPPQGQDYRYAAGTVLK